MASPRPSSSATQLARDAFYACCEDAGAPFSADSAPPKQCRSTRKAYEAACKASWVKHFDRLKDKEVRVVRVLHDNINQRSAQARGGLAGEELNK
eukprot:jgi/Tetstr1/449866/TSEL_036925.t1